MGARDRIAYIRGLLDAGGAGDGVTPTLYAAIVEALEALAAENEELRNTLTEQQKAVEDLNFICGELDADLSEVEACLELDVDDGSQEQEDSEGDELESEYFETTCPYCGRHFFCHSSLMTDSGEVECPDCERRFQPDVVDAEQADDGRDG